MLHYLRIILTCRVKKHYKMKQILILLYCLYSGLAFSQEIEILEKGDTLQKPKYVQFIYLSEKTPLDSITFVAKIKATGSLHNVSNLFLFINAEAQKLGANSFKFESFKTLDSQNGELILSTYYCNGEDDFFDKNFENLPKNKIYIFGSQDMLATKTQSYKINGEKHEIESGKFAQFDIKPDEEVKINKGGFTGMTLWVKRKPEGYSSFLNFSGIGLNGTSYNAYSGGVGVSINTGTINKIEPNLALALLKIYSEQK